MGSPPERQFRGYQENELFHVGGVDEQNTNLRRKTFVEMEIHVGSTAAKEGGEAKSCVGATILCVQICLKGAQLDVHKIWDTAAHIMLSSRERGR